MRYGFCYAYNVTGIEHNSYDDEGSPAYKCCNCGEPDYEGRPCEEIGVRP